MKNADIPAAPCTIPADVNYSAQMGGMWAGIGVSAAFNAVQGADELLAEPERTCHKT